MDSIERRVGKYIKEKGVNMAQLSRDTGIPYVTVYASVAQYTRPLRANEYFAICDYLGVNPMDFADEPKKEGGLNRNNKI